MECKNCGQDFEGNFCQHCGQKANEGRIYVRHVFQDALAFIFSLESPIFKTFLGLLKSPGRFAKSYIAGKRKSFNKPFQYFIVMVAIHLIVMKLANVDYALLQQRAQGLSDEAMMSSSMKIFSFIAKNLNYFSLGMVFWIGLACRVFFLKSKYSFAEILTLFLFVMGQIYTFHNFLMLSAKYIHLYFYYVSHLLLVGYYIWGIMTFFESKWWIRVPLGIFAFILGYFFYFASVGMIAYYAMQ